jgi:hypothetical protein
MYFHDILNGYQRTTTADACGSPLKMSETGAGTTVEWNRA